MTKEELILRYGKDELERTRIDLIGLRPGVERLALLMERFGRAAHDVDLALRELDKNEELDGWRWIRMPRFLSRIRIPKIRGYIKK